MALNTRTRGRVGALTAAALALGGLVAAAPAQAASDSIAIDDATFVWGYSGYAQLGAGPFGAWDFNSFSGGASYLGGGQTQYVAAPVPATSFPASPHAGVAPHGQAVKFTGGSGVVDHADERLEISWTGSFTINAYPVSVGAPSETFADPRLVLEDGSAQLTFDVTIGEGKDQDDNPIPAAPLGRITVLDFSDVDVADVLDGSARLVPDYLGVAAPASVTDQVTTCSTDGGGTGWWGSWPAELVAGMADALRGHYYSTSCGGRQDNKPPLPFDLTFDVDDAPVVTAGPQDVEVVVGETAQLAATVEGADALQWQSRTGSGDWADVAGATAASLEVATTAVAQSGTQFRVVASNASGTVESAAATLTVTKAEAAVSVKVKKKFRFAVKRKATITVDAPAGVAATGAVVVKAGKKVVGKGTVTNGKAKVTLTKKLLPGKRTLVAEFAGSADLTASTSAPVKVQVKKAKSKTKPKIAKAKKLKAGQRPVLRLRVTGKNVKPNGKVRVVVREGKNKIRTFTVRVKGGKVTKVRLPRLDAGKYQVRAKFQGNKKVAKSAKKVTFRVR